MNDMGTDEVNHKQQMEELALNSDFDPGLLDCWADEEEEEEGNVVTTSGSSCNNSLPSSLAAAAAASSVASCMSLTQQQQQLLQHATNACRSNKTSSGVLGLDTTWDDFDKAQQALLMAVSANASLSRPSSLNGVDDVTSLPPFEATTSGSALHQTQQQQQQHQQQPVAAVQQQQQHQRQQQQPPSYPQLHIGHVAASFTGNFQPQPQQQMPNFVFTPMDSAALLPLAFNALAAGVDLSAFFTSAAANGAAAYGPAMANHHQLIETSNNNANNNQSLVQQASAPSAVPSAPSLPPKHPPDPASNTTTAAGTSAAAAPQSPPNNNRGGAKKRTSNTNADGTTGGRKGKGRGKRQAKQEQQHEEEEEEEPPFMLFDAPVELRHNFMQTQRALGIPVLHDNNSYHFARAAAIANNNNTNGTETAPGAQVPYNMPRLADARHGEDATGNKRIKNAKEQKRAQRITELIEQLRVRMEKGGWKVGIKSKLHTLSSCSDYVKHLVKVTKEKEATVEQARNDLEAKRRKIEEEKASQQDPSEPESTTSSLTVSSESRSTNNNNKCGHDANNANNSQEEHNTSSTDKNEDNDNTKHNAGKHNNYKSDNAANQEKHQALSMDCNEEKNTAKGAVAGGAASEDSEHSAGQKRKLSSHDSNNSEGYPSSVENEDNGNKKRRAGGVGQHVSIGPVSSVSDITDNNKYSKGSSATSSSDDITMSVTATPGRPTAFNSTPDEQGADDGEDDGDMKEAAGPAGPSAQNTVCSDAAVAATLGPDKDHSHGGSFNNTDADNRDPAMAIQTITTTKNKSHHHHHHHHHHRKRKLQQELSKLGKKAVRDPSSLENSFRLDYEEVFLKSNVPQIIASTTGRIVAFNEIFLRATCLKRNQVERLTIFSLVQTSMLSNLFELVASSLREDDRHEDRKGRETTTPLQDYSTMTLPCVPFHTDRPPLFMTITLMTDEDVKKRCFHCVFTDCAPGAKGSVGSVTPQLLAILFQPHCGSSQEDRPSGSDGYDSKGGSTGNGTKNSSLTSNSNSAESDKKQHRQPDEELSLKSVAFASHVKKEQDTNKDIE